MFHVCYFLESKYYRQMLKNMYNNFKEKYNEKYKLINKYVNFESDRHIKLQCTSINLLKIECISILQTPY